MKKISLLFVTVILMTALAACSGAKKNDVSANQPVESEAVEAVTVSDPEPEAPVLTPAQMLESFKEYAKTYAEAFNNISKDPKKYSELAGQSKKKVEEMEKIKDKLNKKQSEEYQKALDIVLKVNRGGK